MTPVIRKKRIVERDLDEYFDFIAQDKIEPAERFLTVAAKAFERLAATPGLGRKWETANPRLRGVRVYPMPAPFRSYLVFYWPIDGGVEVLRVLHGALDLEVALREALG